MDPGEHATWFKFLNRDRDSKVTAAFDEVLAGNSMRIINTPVRSPRADPLAGRYAGTLRRECLDHLLSHGQRHLRRILAGYARHDNGRAALSPNGDGLCCAPSRIRTCAHGSGGRCSLP
jgi:putative transposase